MRCLIDGNKESNNTKNIDNNTINNNCNDKNNNNNHEIKFEKFYETNVPNSTKIIDEIIDDDNIVVQSVCMICCNLYDIFYITCHYLHRTRNHIIITR
jgi:hypothetical protein